MALYFCEHSYKYACLITVPSCNIFVIVMQGELACGMLVRDQRAKETLSFILQFGSSATWRVLAIPDDEEPYVIHEYTDEDFAEIHRLVTTSSICEFWLDSKELLPFCDVKFSVDWSISLCRISLHVYNMHIFCFVLIAAW